MKNNLTFPQIRQMFWDCHPQFKKGYIKVTTFLGTRKEPINKVRYRPKTQNEYNTDIRVYWCDFVEHLRRDGQITEKQACNITL